MPIVLVLGEGARAPVRHGVAPGVAAAPALRPAHGPRLEVPDRARVPLGAGARGVVHRRRRTRAGTLCRRGRRRGRRRARRATACCTLADARSRASSSRRSADGLPRRVRASRCARSGKPRGHRPSTRRRSAPKPERLHGRHVLNRYEDGMEKCIGCELCAGVCPARCIYVRGADNPPDDPVSPGERYGFVYEINYLRCIHCDLCVEACPTEAITETKLFEFSFTNRERRDLHQGPSCSSTTTAAPSSMPWEDWARRRGRPHQRRGCGPPSPSGAAAYEGRVGWSGELGFGVRPPEHGPDRDRRRELDRAGRRPPRRRPSTAATDVTAVDLLRLRRARARRRARRGARRATRCTPRCSWCSRCQRRRAVRAARTPQLLAAVQVIVYAGAIVVLFLFVIMLLGVDQHEDLDDDPLPVQRPSPRSSLGVARARRDPRAVARPPAGPPVPGTRPARSSGGTPRTRQQRRDGSRRVAVHRLPLAVRDHRRCCS